MKLTYFSNEFPSDDLPGLARQLHLHSKDRRHHILARFLQDATLAIREEVAQLPPALKDLLPPFESVLTFVEYPEMRRGPLSGSIDGVLLSTVELATFIGYVCSTELQRQECPLTLGASYFEECPETYDLESAHTYLAGLGIGLLSAAAVSLSRTLADIAYVGSEVVRMAFRLGVLVDNVSEQLQPRELASHGTPDSWAYVLPNVTREAVQQELDVIYSGEVSRS